MSTLKSCSESTMFSWKWEFLLLYSPGFPKKKKKDEQKISVAMYHLELRSIRQMKTGWKNGTNGMLLRFQISI